MSRNGIRSLNHATRKI